MLPAVKEIQPNGKTVQNDKGRLEDAVMFWECLKQFLSSKQGQDS